MRDGGLGQLARVEIEGVLAGAPSLIAGGNAHRRQAKLVPKNAFREPGARKALEKPLEVGALNDEALARHSC